MLEQFARQSSEHFEAVQILATFTENGSSHCLKIGAGNWYARLGMAREFLNSDQAQTFANEMPTSQEPPDEGELWKQ